MTIRVTVPATTANLGPGFDCVGLALRMHNQIEATVDGRHGWTVFIEGHGEGELPRDENNLILRAMQHLFSRAGGEAPSGGELRLRNDVPLSSGLGSSAAAIVGGMVTANELLGRPLTDAQVLDVALEMEPHPDNIAAALYGGLVVAVAHGGRSTVVRFDPPSGLQAVVATVDRQLATCESRRLLPEEYTRGDLVFSVGHAALLVAGFASGNREALARAMHDRVHQPYRLPIIPGAQEALQAACDAGAIGAVLSGSGPTLLALCDGNGSAAAVGDAMAAAMGRHHPSARASAIDLEPRGAVVEQ